MILEQVISTLKNAERTGAEIDEPEGVRYVILSDTLVNTLVEKLERLLSRNIQRHHEVAIRIGGDTWKDVIASLRHLEYVFETEGPGRNLTSGGYGSGMIAVDVINEEVTHDSYFEEIEAWIQARRKDNA